MVTRSLAHQRQTRTSIGTVRSRPRVSTRNLMGLGRYLVLRCRHRNLRVGLFFVDRGFDIQIEPHAVITFGHGVRFLRDFTGHFAGRVTIGHNVFFNRGCHVVAHESLVIGNNCLFGERVSIHDENHVPDSSPAPIVSRGFRTAPIIIGNNVWVGAKATILPGVTIGDNAVIGAHAVVTRDIPPNSVAVGIPARVIKHMMQQAV